MPTDETFCRVHDAARCLAGDGPIKERLLEAWSGHIAQLDPQALPAQMRAAYLDTQFAFQSVRPQRGETPARASVRKMSVADAVRHAQLVVDLFAELARGRAAAVPRQSPPRTAAGAPVVELFAAEG